MTYIEILNAFWNWRKFNVIPHSAADLFYCLLDFANTTKWEDKITIPNSRITGKIDISEKSLFNARNSLIQLGLINYDSGRKGQAGTYQINITILQNFINMGSNTGSNKRSNSGVINGTIAEQYREHNKDKDKEQEKDKDERKITKKKSALSSVVVCYENNISPITQIVRDSMIDWLNDVDSDVIIWAINEAVKLNKRNWKYIEGILRNQFNKGNTTMAKITASEKERDRKYEFNKRDDSQRDEYDELFKKFELG